ncbi:endothelial cell-specific chemotaxis regulator isoform X2 [Gracilinanus agilis]|uniref:endothelial cell-specific chemotaxis regulator isoform X2 n=1 Tax=Gracilinanus agilis TaxID=191870 RepID=UPI001CFC5A00|nr:endothelial cell-specific chemotaxis regulator isoform X2 [Gracilinanus agilis]
MRTIRAQLCLGIISYILFQGAFSQSPPVQSPGFQQGSESPSFTAHAAPQSTTGITGTSAPSYKIRERSQISTFSVTASDIPKSTIMDLRTTEKPILPTPTSETVLTVAAFGVITFIIILVVVVIILVSVVSLRFKCRKNKESEDPQKPENCGMSESSAATGEKDTSITLISMKNINSNNNKGCYTEEKVL